MCQTKMKAFLFNNFLQRHPVITYELRVLVKHAMFETYSIRKYSDSISQLSTEIIIRINCNVMRKCDI